jgi:hypothetical protein
MTVLFLFGERMKNAKIEYTVRIETIPEEVKRRLEEVAVLLKNNALSIKEAVSNCTDENCSRANNLILSVREDISYLDTILAESNNIISGYLAFKAGKYDVQEPQNDV